MGQTDLTCRTFSELEVDSSLTLHVASSLLRTLYTHHFVWQHQQLALSPGNSNDLKTFWNSYRGFGWLAIRCPFGYIFSVRSFQQEQVWIWCHLTHFPFQSAVCLSINFLVIEFSSHFKLKETTCIKLLFKTWTKVRGSADLQNSHFD